MSDHTLPCHPCRPDHHVQPSSGVRALTHRAVDAAADVPSGTASYHFRTRRELLRGVLTRISEINHERLALVPGPPTDAVDVPRSRAERLTEADQLAGRIAGFVDGLQFDRLVGVGSLSAAPPGTPESRAEIASVLRSYLTGLVP